MARTGTRASPSLAWRDPITRALEGIRDELNDVHGGAVATYIPELSRANPSSFGLAVASLEGQVYHAGDTDVAFTIQSVSKPFVLALAVADVGPEALARHVRAEPSGEAFNAISLEPGTGRPANPMVNAGAIVTSSLVRGAGPEERFERIRRCLSAFAGRELELDGAVLESERQTGDRNRALAYLMRNAGSLPGDVDEILDVYFSQCSLLVTTGDLAAMAATLANGGVNPLTGVAVTTRDVTAHVLTIMATCGMYDYAGEWMLRVGLPAKSGVSGGLVAASPGQFGIGLFSPPIDELGNSVRAVAASELISDRLGLHLMRVPSRPARPVYLSAAGDTMHSTRKRRHAESAALADSATAIAVRRIGGDLEFAEAEILVRSLAAAPADHGVRWLVLDLHRVTRVHPAAGAILAALIADILARGVAVPVVDPGAFLSEALAVERFTSLDAALEWCEDQLLGELGPEVSPDAVVPLLEHDVIASIEPPARATLVDAIDERELDVGEAVLGEESELVAFVLSGRLGAHIASTGARTGSLGPGAATSRVRLLSGPAGREDLRAETRATVAVLCADRLAAAEAAHPGVTGRVWTALTRWAALVEA